METTSNRRRVAEVERVSSDELGTLPGGARWIQLPLDLYFPTGKEEVCGHDGESSSPEDREHCFEDSREKTPRTTQVE